ncbi:hypothetical protein PHAVU_010G150200 [Phaseolus vulgaris]|uniref:IST1-like protein n=1 Tax=Phaseolus vulgaris TaxID=3885 RepID=V7ASV8_PHAVU|nr:hypothetical protein PHAVU_010G150200g [Phaseolus vulgaris]ESW07683.1 hypothetical protein PHAVU_010G150200g [Phaseolus vulgaris]
MFRWLLKPRFDSKCLSYLKSLKIRLGRVQNRKKAEVKFLKSVIAELLTIGLEDDAYTRAKELLLEQKTLSSYELIEKFVGCISDHVEDFTKQKDCPEECKEAVSSLMDAAARTGDLPELRQLRTLFTDKYGNSLEPYANKEEKPIAGEDFNTPKGKERDTQHLGRKNLSGERWMHQNSSSDDETSMSSHDGRKGRSSSSFGSISEDEVETNMPISSYWGIPPPYLKQKTNKSDSKKPTHADTATAPDSGGVKSGKGKGYPSQQPEHGTGQIRRRRSSHVRGKSLPSEPNTAEETSKGHIRTVSLESGMRGGASHVHPKLPDYDDLRAHFLALRKR